MMHGQTKIKLYSGASEPVTAPCCIWPSCSKVTDGGVQRAEVGYDGVGDRPAGHLTQNLATGLRPGVRGRSRGSIPATSPNFRFSYQNSAYIYLFPYTCHVLHQCHRSGFDHPNTYTHTYKCNKGDQTIDHLLNYFKHKENFSGITS